MHHGICCRGVVASSPGSHARRRSRPEFQRCRRSARDCRRRVRCALSRQCFASWLARGRSTQPVRGRAHQRKSAGDVRRGGWRRPAPRRCGVIVAVATRHGTDDVSGSGTGPGGSARAANARARRDRRSRSCRRRRCASRTLRQQPRRAAVIQRRSQQSHLVTSSPFSAGCGTVACCPSSSISRGSADSPATPMTDRRPPYLFPVCRHPHFRRSERLLLRERRR